MTIFKADTIRAKILTIMLVAGIPIILAAALLIHAKYRSDYRDVEYEALITVKSLAYQHSTQVEGIRNLLITLSEFPEVQQLHKDGANAILQDILKKSPSSLNIGLADRQGNLVASSVPASFNIADRKYFQDALRSKRFSAGEYVVSRAVGKPAIHFALPILDSSGEAFAVLYATYDLTTFETFFKEQKLPENSVMNLTDHRGVVLYRYPLHDKIKPGLQDKPELRSKITTSRDEGTFVAVGLDNTKRFFAYKQLRLFPDDPPYLYLRVTVPEQAALAGVYRLIGISVALCLLAAILAIILTHLLAKQLIIKPVQRMVEVAEAVTAGDLSIRTGLIDRDDELGSLARSIDTMSETLQRRLAERDSAEMQIRRLNKELEHAVQERTQQLETANAYLTEEIEQRSRSQQEITSLNINLQQQKSALEAANQELESFSYSVSHDLRAPLRHISGFSQALSEMLADRLDQGAADYLQRIDQASRRMAELIDGLLTLSRCSREEMHIRPLDLSCMVEEIIQALQQGEPARSVALHICREIKADGDPVLLKAALQNLLSNAWKYTAKTEAPVIEFGCTKTESAPVYFIRDNGAGFSMEFADQLFIPFQRLHLAEEFDGIGIGLATVQRIIQRHGGRIWADSAPNQGTTFYFTLADARVNEASR